MPDRKVDNYIAPMLAREVDQPFNDKGWVYEMKYDGFRAIAEVNGKNIKLYSRNGNSFNVSYPLVVKALSELNINAVLDGEIIVLDEQGKSNFQKLQSYKSDSTPPMEFRVFDLLYISGKNICEETLLERKKKLKALIGKGNRVIKYSDHIFEKGKEFFEAAKAQDLEGIIAKDAGSEYHPGVRTNTWLKIKNHKSTETVVVGYTEPTGSRKYFGSLILGIYDKGKLKYAGHTGSGFDQKLLAEIYNKLQKLVVKASPFSPSIKTNTPATWVKPQLVAEIKYSEWTRDGLLRHPIFLRLRSEKKAKDITMSVNKPGRVGKAVSKAAASDARKSKSRKSGAVSSDSALSSSKTRPEGISRAGKSGNRKKAEKKEEFLKVGSHNVKVTNLTKVYWPEEGYTKGDVIKYYQSVGKYILPYLKNRPQSLKRNPNGIKDFGFFHKDAGEEAPFYVKSEPIYSEGAKKTIDYIICNNLATLTYMNNLGCIEINPWHSTIAKQDHPDYMIIDIDPSDKNTFEQVIEAANVVHEILDRAGADSYCKTSGATGLHVYVPMGKKYDYEQVKNFAHLVCMLAADELPSFTTLTRNLKKRGNKHIYMDYLQNRKGQTISSVYSLRPKEGATVSMPLHWKEVKKGLSPQDFNIDNALRRIQKTGDIFSGVLGKGVDLKKCLRLLEK